MFVTRIFIGYILAYLSFLPWIARHCRIRQRDPDALLPEARLYWLLYGTFLFISDMILGTDAVIVAPLLAIGLFGFSWTSLGPPHVHWIAPMIFSTLIAIANVSLSGIYPNVKTREIDE